MSLLKTARLLPFLLLSVPVGALAQDYTQGSLKIGHPYVRAMIPGAAVGAGYLTVENTGNMPDRLLSATSSRAGAVEIHEMSVKDGTMKMRKLAEPLEIPAGQKIALEPGGYHLMFKQVAAPFKQGETIPVTLTFEKAGTLETQFVAEAAAAGVHKAMDGMSMPAKP